MLNLNSGMPSKRLGRTALAISCVAVLCSAVLLGQSTVSTGSIRGTVSDQTGKPLAGASVTFTNKATRGVVDWTTSPDGTFSSGPLQPGEYTIRVEAKGFKTVEIPAVAHVGTASLASVKLEAGAETPAAASSAPPSINTEQPAVQSVRPARQIDNLPISGRAIFDFAQLEPGIQLQDGGILAPGKIGFSSISFLGRYGRATRVTVDGVDVSEEVVGATTQNLPASAIQEFQLSQSTLDLTTGLTSSGAVNVATRSGGNALHGEGFGSYRGNQAAASLPGSSGQPFEQDQYGGRVGGALIKDKVFWFLAGERVLRDLRGGEPFPAPFDALGATLAQPYREVQGDGRLDWQRRDNAHAFVRFNFAQNSQVGPFGSASSLQALKSTSHAPSGTVGYDFNTGPNTHSLRFEYLRFSSGTSDGTAGLAGLENPIPGLGINIGAPVAGNCALGGGAYCAGPSSLAPQVNFQSNYELRYDGSRMMGPHIVRYGATFNRLQGGGFVGSYNYPQVGTSTTCLPVSVYANCVGSNNATAYPADFVFLSNGRNFSTAKSAFGYPGGGLGPDNRLEAYVGDAWKVIPNVTLSYGLHYAHDTGRLNSDLGPLPVLRQWAPGLGNSVRNPGNNVAPQFGFVWNMGGGGATVIRGGAGLFWDTSLWNNARLDSPARIQQGPLAYTRQVCSYGVANAFTWPASLADLPVNSAIAGGAGVVVNPGASQVQPTFCGSMISTAGSQVLTLSNAFQAAASAGARPNNNFVGTTLSASNVNGLDVFDPNYRTPRSYQMNLGFEHEVRPGTMFSVDFIRNVGERFLLIVDQNHSGAARSYNLANAIAARDKAQLNAATLYHGSQNCPAGLGQVQCMITSLGGIGGAQAAYSAAGLDSNSATTGGGPCSFCAFPGITPNGVNNAGAGVGNGSLGTLDMLSPVGRSTYGGAQIKLTHRLVQPMRGINAVNFQLAYTYSKYKSQGDDQDFPTVATNNDNALQFTGPAGMDRKHQVSFAAMLDLPFSLKLSMIGRFYSPLAETLRLPELTSGGEIFATDWLGSGLGSGAPPEPLKGTQVGQFMRGTDVPELQSVITTYNGHFAGTLTPAGHCLVGDASCPGLAPVQVMTPTDMSALGWVLPQVASVPISAVNPPWLKTMDFKLSWPLKFRDRFTIEPSASVFNVANFANEFLAGNQPLGSLLPGGSNGTLAPNAVGGVTDTTLAPFRARFQSGTYAAGAPRQFEFGLRISF